MISFQPNTTPADVTDFHPHLWLKTCLSGKLTGGPGGGDNCWKTLGFLGELFARFPQILYMIIH